MFQCCLHLYIAAAFCGVRDGTNVLGGEQVHLFQNLNVDVISCQHGPHFVVITYRVALKS